MPSPSTIYITRQYDRLIYPEKFSQQGRLPLGGQQVGGT